MVAGHSPQLAVREDRGQGVEDVDQRDWVGVGAPEVLLELGLAAMRAPPRIATQVVVAKPELVIGECETVAG